MIVPESASDSRDVFNEFILLVFRKIILSVEVVHILGIEDVKASEKVLKTDIFIVF